MAKPHISWTAKYGKLGFDPTRRLLYIGTVEGQQAWLAFAPKTLWHPELLLPKRYADDRGNKSTLMPQKCYRRAVCMMASFCDSLQIQGIMTETVVHAWSASTNIL